MLQHGWCRHALATRSKSLSCSDHGKEIEAEMSEADQNGHRQAEPPAGRQATVAAVHLDQRTLDTIIAGVTAQLREAGGVAMEAGGRMPGAANAAANPPAEEGTQEGKLVVQCHQVVMVSQPALLQAQKGPVKYEGKGDI